MILTRTKKEVVMFMSFNMNLNRPPDPDHLLASLVIDCQTLHGQMWNASITYVPHNYNVAADSLAKLGHHLYNTTVNYI